MTTGGRVRERVPRPPVLHFTVTEIFRKFMNREENWGEGLRPAHGLAGTARSQIKKLAEKST